MNCHVEWIRNFLLRKSTLPLNTSSNICNNIFKPSLSSGLSAHRFQLLKPGVSSFIDHMFYSFTISLIDSKFSYENSNFSIVRSYLLNFLPSLNVSINELESKTFTQSHRTLSKSILIFYIRFYIKPSTISPTCFGIDIETYERSLYEWGRSICKSEIPYLPGNFMIDFGTAQVVSIILSKIHPELIQLNRITFSQHLNQSEIARNWREVGTALSVIGVHVPTEKEWGDNLCLLCFGVDLFRSVYNKSKISNLVEYQMQQNQTNQQRYYENYNNNEYCANDEINKIDFLINQMNSISNGNPKIYLSEPFQQNPILVQQQRIIQQQQHQQQIYQLIQDRQQQQQQPVQQLNSITFDQPDKIQDDSRIKIVSNKKQILDLNHCESQKPSIPKSQINDELIHLRAEKYKLLEENEKLEKQIKTKKTKNSKEKPKTETIQNFKIMSSFAIDPSFPNQCKLTTSKEVIRHKKDSQNQFKTLQTLEKQRQKKKKKIESNLSPDSTVKCSYITFDNKEDDRNQNNTNKQKENIQFKSHSKSRNVNGHHSKSKNHSLFDDVIEADKPDYQDPKSSQDFQDILSKQKEEFKKDKKKGSLLDGSKSGTDLLNSINSFIEQQKEAIAAASLAKKAENPKQKVQKPLPDFSQFDASQPGSIKIFDTDPVLLINSKSKEKKSDKELDKSQSSSSSSSLIRKKSEKKSSLSDPLVELAKQDKSKNPDMNEYDPFHSSSSSAAARLNSSESKRSKKSDSFENSNSKKISIDSKSSKKSDNFESDSNSIAKLNAPKENKNNNKFDSFENESNLPIKMNSSDSKSNKKSDSFELESEPNPATKPNLSDSKRNKKSDSFDDTKLNSSAQKENKKADSFEIEPNSINSKSDQYNSNFDSNIPTIKSSDSAGSQNNNNNKESASKNNGFDEFEIEEEESPSSFNEEQQETPKNDENAKSDFTKSNQNISSNFSQMKNSSKFDDFSNMKSDLTFPDIPSLIDQSFRFDQKSQTSEKAQNSTNLSEKVPIENKNSSQHQNSINLSEKVPIEKENSERIQNSSQIQNSNIPSEKVTNNDQSSFPKKRPIPLPLSNSTNFNSSSSRLPLLPKTNGQKSDSLTPAELSIVSSLDVESTNQNQKQEIESISNSMAKNLNDDNELSIEQITSHSNGNSDSFSQNSAKKATASKKSSSAIEGSISQSSAKIESAVEEFIPEIERFSSGSEQKRQEKKKNKNKNNSSSSFKSDSENNQIAESNNNKISLPENSNAVVPEEKIDNSIKKFHSSSSSSDSIPFKVIHSDSEKNLAESNVNKKKSEEEEIENSKPFTSVIEEFDLSSLKPKRKQSQIQSISGPIILNEEPVPKAQNKGPSSETRRVSFSLGPKGFAPQSSLNKLNKTSSTSGNSSLTFNGIDNDIDTFMSTASLSQSMSIPIEERLKMYSKDHNELSLPLSEIEPEVIQEYRDESAVNVDRKYIWLSNDEQNLLENVLPIIVANSDSHRDVNGFISKELKMPKNSSTVNRIAANIKAFLLSREKRQ